MNDYIRTHLVVLLQKSGHEIQGTNVTHSLDKYGHVPDERLIFSRDRNQIHYFIWLEIDHIRITFGYSASSRYSSSSLIRIPYSDPDFFAKFKQCIDR